MSDVRGGPCKPVPCRGSGTVSEVRRGLCWGQGSDTDPAERRTDCLVRTAARSSPGEEQTPSLKSQTDARTAKQRFWFMRVKIKTPDTAHTKLPLISYAY